jgi:hypothetical protein
MAGKKEQHLIFGRKGLPPKVGGVPRDQIENTFAGGLWTN